MFETQSNLFDILAYVLIFLILYPFVIYPLLLQFISIFLHKKVKSDSNYIVPVTVLTAAYNEESVIEECVRSVFNSDYPIEKLNMIVGSDGSDDKTIEILEKLSKEFPNLSYHQLPRGGKNNVLNEILFKAQTDLVIVFDADLRFEKGTIRKLVSNFSDQTIGAVLPKFRIEIKDDNTGGSGEKMYQNFEAFLRDRESKILSNINPIGACCYRKELLEKIPSNNLCDDLYYMTLTNSKNYRVLYDKEFEVKEVREKSLGFEFNRRIRLVAGGISTLFHFPSLLSPSGGFRSLFIWSHKLSRYLAPFFLIVLAILAFLISNQILHNLIIYSYLYLILGSVLGYLLEKINITFVLFKIPLFYLTMVTSFLFGIFRWLKGQQNAVWGREGLHDL